MLRIGLTGGIGSGKTTVSRIFETLGIPVYYADEAARKIMNDDALLKEQIISCFGPTAYTPEGLNRAYISAIVFNDEKKLEQLNAVVHPATLRHADEWMRQQHGPYAIKEAALIFESGSQNQLDYVIGVSAPEALRMERTMQRDGSSQEAVQARMRQQIEESVKMKLCDFIVYNDEQQLLIPQVLTLHEQLSALSLAK